MNLGPSTGGVRLLYNESVSGVITWSLAAPLFSLNLVFLTSLIQRSTGPLRRMFSPAGVEEMGEQLVRVLRWGLWMAPVIYSFLRLAPDPTWYNQDGALRTAVATWKSVSLSPGDFRAWSLEVFLGLLAYDWLRILIWFDHMGLRVATLVNFSFVGGDVFDEKAAQWLGHHGRTRVVPEGIRRFATWAPLLLPFYIPRGAEWARVWTQQEAMHVSPGPLLPAVAQIVVGYIIGGIALIGVIAWVARRVWASSSSHLPGVLQQDRHCLSNGVWALDLEGNGSCGSRVLHHAGGTWDLDITRRSRDPARFGGVLFHLSEVEGSRRTKLGLTGWLPRRWRHGECSVQQPSPTSLVVRERIGSIVVETHITVPEGDALELWKIKLVNEEDRPRSLEIASYLEWGLNSTDAYLRRASFNALHIGTCFVRDLQCIMAHNRLLKSEEGQRSREVAFHAVGSSTGAAKLKGYEDCRPRFIGTGTVSAPVAVALGDWRPANDEGLLYTFDPIASLCVGIHLAPREAVEIVFANGFATDSMAAERMITKHLTHELVRAGRLGEVESKMRQLHDSLRREEKPLSFEFSSHGETLRAGWPTPRPWTHVMANEAGCGVVASNAGALFSFAGNAQQNGLTPFTLDTVATPTPGQAVCIFEPKTGTMHQANTPEGIGGGDIYETVCGPGWMTFHRSVDDLESELTVFVPPDLQAAMKLLRLRNTSPETRRLRITFYDEIALAELNDDSRGKLETVSESDSSILLFRHPQNDFAAGWASAATTLEAPTTETIRSRFLGGRQDFSTPSFAATGIPEGRVEDDGFRIAAFSELIEIPPGAEISIGAILGWAASFAEARALAARHLGVDEIRAALASTRAWWRKELSAIQVRTSLPEFDRMVNVWLPYQALVSRLWGRTGPEQRSGARGSRDQLQDVLPFAAVNPARARKEILLHSAQQFLEGDVMAWWHQSASGDTGLGARTRASDVQLWLPYVVAEYVAASGDAAILDAQTPFLEGKEIPVHREGTVFVPQTSQERASLHEHCKRAINYTLARCGEHGLPLMGAGDWNDGLNEVGSEGRGESVWLGFFLHGVLVKYADLCRDRGDQIEGLYRMRAADLAAALQKMWRHDRYVRAINDDGIELSFSDALMGAWPVLSGVAGYERGLEAVQGTLAHLERKNSILLLTPPFTGTGPSHIGRIEDYPPGVRENGGQYSHGASWLVDALARLAELAPDERAAQRLMKLALRCWIKVSPLDDIAPDQIERYGLAPHQQPADVYAGECWDGRGGWSWYSGSAARMLSAAYRLLGLRFDNGQWLRTNLVPHGEIGEMEVHSITFKDDVRCALEVT